MTAAEKVCRERGVVEVGLSVFGFNSGARALYEQGNATFGTLFVAPDQDGDRPLLEMMFWTLL